jgi:hypothetical protein
MNRKRTIRHFVLVLVAAHTSLICGCTGNLSRSEMLGIYDSQHNGVRQILTLSDNGDFTQEVILPADTNSYFFRGTWEFESSSWQVTFDSSFRLVFDPRDRLKTDFRTASKGIVVLPVESVFGRISLGSREGVLFRKRQK